jgi:hypothetical protein
MVPGEIAPKATSKRVMATAVSAAAMEEAVDGRRGFKAASLF